MVGRGRRCYFRQLLWLELHRIRDKLHRLSHRNGNCNTVLHPFAFMFAELATAIPQLRRPRSLQSKRHLPRRRLFAGFSYLVESLFCTPGICIAVGAYVHTLFPVVPAVVASVVAYLIFLFINMRIERPVSSSALSSPLSVLQALFSTHASAAPRRLQPAQAR